MTAILPDLAARLLPSAGGFGRGVLRQEQDLGD
jgi:hypothetical protein